jgi:hypothetical protein
VFLSAPGTGQTASLYYTDAEYDELGRLVGENQSSPASGTDSPGAGRGRGPSITVTWLLHDVEPWRVDTIYLEGKAGPWISTQSSFSGSIWDASVVWHQPTEAKRLIQLLGELGLTEQETAGSSSDADAGSRVVTSEPRTQTPQSVREEPAGSPWQTDAGWAAAGLVVGALLTLGWSRARRRTPDVPPDVPPNGTPLAGREPRAEILTR